MQGRNNVESNFILKKLVVYIFESNMDKYLRPVLESRGHYNPSRHQVNSSEIQMLWLPIAKQLWKLALASRVQIGRQMISDGCPISTPSDSVTRTHGDSGLDPQK